MTDQPRPTDALDLTQARCPTCGHMHPHRMGLSLCACDDCSLLWTTIPRQHLAPEYAKRLADLEAKVRNG